MSNAKAVFKKLGPVKAVKFFQNMGIGKGDSVKEIEGITEKFSRKEALERLRKYRS